MDGCRSDLCGIGARVASALLLVAVRRTLRMWNSFKPIHKMVKSTAKLIEGHPKEGTQVWTGKKDDKIEQPTNVEQLLASAQQRNNVVPFIQVYPAIQAQQLFML